MHLRNHNLIGKEIWVNTSSFAMGMSLKDNGAVIKDACWLCPDNDTQHINLAEHDVVVKGINLALQWQAKVLHLKTDFWFMYHWLKNSLSRKAKVWTKAVAEMLVRRRLQTLLQFIEEYGLEHWCNISEVRTE